MELLIGGKNLMRFAVFFLIIAVFLSGCTVTEELSCPENYILSGDICCLDKNANSICDSKEAEGSEALSCPESCDDSDSCTFDVCDESTSFECVNRAIRPCCGNDVCEKGESSSTCEEDCVPELPPLTIESKTTRVDATGKFAVVGEIKNNLDYPITDVKIDITFLDNESKAVGTVKTLSRMSTILPSKKSPFSVYFSGKYGMVSKIEDVDFDITYEKAKSEPYSNFDIVESTGSFNSRGGFDIIGGVRNTGSQKGRIMVVIASFYNDKKEIVAEKFTYVQPDSNEKIGETHQFFIGIDKDSAKLVKSYSLQVDSN